MRLDRNTFVFVALAFAVGDVLADTIVAIAIAVQHAVINSLDDEFAAFASFKVGAVEVLYGSLVAALLSLGLAVGLARLVLRNFVKPS